MSRVFVVTTHLHIIETHPQLIFLLKRWAKTRNNYSKIVWGVRTSKHFSRCVIKAKCRSWCLVPAGETLTQDILVLKARLLDQITKTFVKWMADITVPTFDTAQNKLVQRAEEFIKMDCWLQKLIFVKWNYIVFFNGFTVWRYNISRLN